MGCFREEGQDRSCVPSSGVRSSHLSADLCVGRCDVCVVGDVETADLYAGMGCRCRSETITSGERLGVGEGSRGRRMLWRGECDGDECGAEMGVDENARIDG